MKSASSSKRKGPAVTVSRSVTHHARSLSAAPRRQGLGMGPGIAALLLFALAELASAESFDVIVRHGSVLDGTGAGRYVADVGVSGGRISRVGDLSRATAVLDIDARGLFVVPGFINIHDHPEPDAIFKAENMLTQGVTTEIGNPDGSGSPDLDSQLRTLTAKGLATNLGLYIGFNAIWAEVMGPKDLRPDAAELERMQALVLRGLRAGAWGLSAGLDYKPAYFARKDEIVRIVSVAGPWRTNFPNHERLTPEQHYSSLAGVTETVDIALQAGLAPVLTHMKAQGSEQQHAREQLELIDSVRRSGHLAAGDIYPYTYGFNNISSLLIPAWAMEGGDAAFHERLKDPVARVRVIRDIEQVMLQRWNGPEGVYIVPLNRELTDLMHEWNVSAGEAIVRLNETHERSFQTYLRFGIEADMTQMLRHPSVAVACDCGSLLAISGHPRAFGTFPMVLRRYVRETGLLSWEEAIRKMTGLPASIIGLNDRGFIAAGMAADITVLDPRTITDRGTATSPQLSAGIRYVLVNGRLTLNDGQVTGAQGGAVLRRAANMPSRPCELSRTRQVSGTVDLVGDGAARMRFALLQRTGQRHAAGHISVTDREGRTLLSSIGLGVLQMTSDWASITGQARLSNGETRAFTLIVDRAGATAAAGPGIELSVDSAYVLRGSANAVKLSLGR